MTKFLFETTNKDGETVTIVSEFSSWKAAEDAAAYHNVKLLGEFIEAGEAHSTVLQ